MLPRRRKPTISLAPLSHGHARRSGARRGSSTFIFAFWLEPNSCMMPMLEAK